MSYATELREKAAKMADAGSTKVTNTRDRWTSQPSKNINWDADIKPAPSPPPPKVSKAPKPLPPPKRTSPSGTSDSPPPNQKPPAPPVPPSRRTPGTSTSSQPLGPPPTIRRDTRPDLAVPSASSPPPPRAPSRSPAPAPPPPRRSAAPPKIIEPAQDIDRIDWANLSPEDKLEFFGWLDEFFSRLLSVPVPPRSAGPTVQHIKVPPGAPTPPPMTGPPKIPSTTFRPRTPPRSSDTDFTMSFPPPTERDSAAEDFAYYFHPSTPWPTAWYASDSDNKPPPLKDNKHIAWTASWSSDGTTKTLHGGVLFSDLSLCWYTVAWPQRQPTSAHRSAQYLPRPAAWPRAPLVDAHATYGETVAGFAESFEDGGAPCARGECWDLANEALKHVAAYDYVPRPVPSISRTHGHRVYEGFARDKGRVQAGRWRGGDDRVRRGDVVEWRSARVGMGAGAYAVLGNPDHTAVVVRDMVPKVGVEDGQRVRPAEMGVLEVIEQSLGNPPKRQRYDLAQLEEGEVWIYRPVGMEAYVGALLSAECPEGVNTLSVG